jgi:hypothetical protein
MRLIIHVGLHRAASTALQHWMKDNSQAIENKKLYAAGPLSGRNPAAATFGFLIGKQLSDLGPATAADRLLSRLETLRERYGTVMLSDENLLGPMPDTVGGAFARLTSFLEVLGKVGSRCEVVPVIILREHVSWLLSIHAVQQLRGESLDFEAFANSPKLRQLRYQTIVEGLSGDTCRRSVLVTALEEIAADSGAAFLTRIAQLAGIDLPPGERLPVANASPPPLLGRIALEVTRQGGCLAQPGRSELRELCHLVVGGGASAAAARQELVAVVARKSVMMPAAIRGAGRQ